MVGLTMYAVATAAKATSANAAFEAIVANVGSVIDCAGIVACSRVSTIVVMTVRTEGIKPKEGAA